MSRSLVCHASVIAAFASVCVFLAGCGSPESSPATPPEESNGDAHDHDGDAHDHDGDAHDHDGDHDHDGEHDEDADGHSHPETLSGAFEELDELHAAIKEAFSAGDADKAHGPLHDIGHALEEVSALADKESLSEEDQAKVKGAIDQLFDGYGAVDERMHKGEEAGKSYDEVADAVDDAMDVLRATINPEQQP
jgi:hypothetical protein